MSAARVICSGQSASHARPRLGNSVLLAVRARLQTRLGSAISLPAMGRGDGIPGDAVGEGRHDEAPRLPGALARALARMLKQSRRGRVWQPRGRRAGEKSDGGLQTAALARSTGLVHQIASWRIGACPHDLIFSLVTSQAFGEPFTNFGHMQGYGFWVLSSGISSG